MLVTHRPAGPLASCVDTIWFLSRPALPHSRERSLPTGRVDLVIPLLQDSVVRFDGVDSTVARHLRGAVVSGAHDRFAVRGMGGPSSVIGVHFKAGGAAALLGGALRDLRNRTVLLDELWGPMARELRERLQVAPQVAQRLRIVEAALLARLQQAPPADAMAAWALQALAGDPTAARIEAVQRASGCTAPQFIRRFEAAVGLTPKRYARVLRFNALLPRLVKAGPIDWAEAAVAGGYFDQSHLIHEFKRLAGVTPAAYVPVQAGQPTHVAIADAPAATRKNLQYAGRREG
jgi:AraC-like DNA-binding protein